MIEKQRLDQTLNKSSLQSENVSGTVEQTKYHKLIEKQTLHQTLEPLHADGVGGLLIRRILIGNSTDRKNAGTEND